MRTLYIVERESSEGLEQDIFTDQELAEEWAEHIAGDVRIAHTIDRHTLGLLKDCTEKVTLDEETPDE